MRKILYGLLAVVLATGVLSGTVRAADVANITQGQAQSVNTGNGANIGGDANTVSGTGRGAGGPGDGEGPGNGAGQGIGNGPSERENGSSENEDEASRSLMGAQTTLVASSDMAASPAPEPAMLVLLGVGGVLLVTFWLKIRSARISKRAA